MADWNRFSKPLTYLDLLGPTWTYLDLLADTELPEDHIENILDIHPPGQPPQ
jgi:hypothetical protein